MVGVYGLRANDVASANLRTNLDLLFSGRVKRGNIHVALISDNSCMYNQSSSILVKQVHSQNKRKLLACLAFDYRPFSLKKLS